jgi:Ca2+:H+ antiporter
LEYLYALLILVPSAFILEFLIRPSPIIIFVISALALIPVAAVLGKATEELAIHTGPRIGGLLNATLGNAAELIIAIVALNAGLVELKASITGSILGNLLVVLGASLLVGGLKNGIQRFNRTETGVIAALMLLSVIAMAVPTLFDRTVGKDIMTLSEEVAAVMIIMYLASLGYSFIFGPGPGRVGSEIPAQSLDRTGETRPHREQGIELLGERGRAAAGHGGSHDPHL